MTEADGASKPKSYREAMFGIPETVHAAVDADTAAAVRGPRALDLALDGITPEDCLTRYRALLIRLTYHRMSQPRNAVYAFAAGQARAERTQDRSWSA